MSDEILCTSEGGWRGGKRHGLYYVTEDPPDNKHKAIADDKAIVQWNQQINPGAGYLFML